MGVAGVFGEYVEDRAARHVNSARVKLRWLASILNETDAKPRGMHWKTYQRLKSQHDELVQVSFTDIGRKLGFLQKMLEG